MTNTTDYSKMTKEEILEVLKKKEQIIEQGKTKIKDQVIALMEQGYNTIKDIAEQLETTNKNISSNLTAIRHDLKSSDKTIISHKLDGTTYLKIVQLSWLTSPETE